MNKYVIMSYDIHALGGCQNYIYGKSQNLEQKGWSVYVIFAGPKHFKTFAFPFLAKYSDGNIPGLAWIPAYLPHKLQNRIIDSMLSLISYSQGDHVLIESHHDKTHIWGELLAAKTGGKHMCFNCNELFRGEDKYFEPFLDFYRFKFERKELYGIVDTSIQKLFAGYLNIPVQKRFLAGSPDPVQDVELTTTFPPADWNVCYIGRILKSYVENVVKGMADFAGKYSCKKINYVFVGDASVREEFIKKTLSCHKNVNIIFMGNMVPIPRKLMTLMDASIAGSGCIRCSYGEGIPTIVPDPKTCQSNGIYGFETDTFLYGDPSKQIPFDISLERVLVEKVHTYLPPISVPKPKNASIIYDGHMQMISESSQKLDYYPSDILLQNDAYKSLPFKQKILRLFNYIYRNI